MASAKSSGARWEVGHAASSRFGSLGLKTTQAAGFLVWASKPRSGELSEAKRAKNVPRHVAKWFRWFGPQNHQDGGFPSFGLKTGVRARRRLGDPKDAWRTRGGCVELRQGAPITRGRPMGIKKETDENAPAWAV
jgi:hypothetical protein